MSEAASTARSRRDIRASLGWDDSHFVFLSVGSRTGAKGMPDLIEAFLRCAAPLVQLVTASDGAEAARLSVSAPFPYDEYVLVLSGEVTLTSDAGYSQTFAKGDSFLVPKGWTGIWDMPGQYLEKIVVETVAWNAAEG